MQQNSFERLMTTLSDKELQGYLDNKSKYIPEAIEAALAEIQKRGRVFSAAELSALQTEINSRKEVTPIAVEVPATVNPLWKKLAPVDDPNAPVFYSEKAIYLFSILFNVLFGTILTAINFSKTEQKKGIFEVIAFGVGYTAVMLTVLTQFPGHPILIVIFNITGAMILQLFWNKYIGKDVQYHARPIWGPLIIGLILVVFMLLSIFPNGEIPANL
ncbi:MAG: hypothetical protein RIR11_558 [Bacteroidota bacterium]